ncbi:hypothetical protein [Cohnella caldifontis]|uniref:hypothetical protein n=1 Tax=Cohnella caldifontis TaxID=3027471 RepID=UPI0023EAC262|nr:hypothetical protein [Cohnella sp. YIM B05605]
MVPNVQYRFDPGRIEIRESANGEDAEFLIRIPDGSPYLEAMKQIRQYFEDNDEITDVLFYLYPGHEIKAIVNRAHYADFLGELWKRRLLLSLEWKE